MPAKLATIEPEPRIEVAVRFDVVQVMFNGVLHLHLYKPKLLGVQSWISEREGKFCVECVMDGGSILGEYDSKEKWLAVLDGLARAL